MANILIGRAICITQTVGISGSGMGGIVACNAPKATRADKINDNTVHGASLSDG